METTLRIDEETYGSSGINTHQQITLSRIFEKLENTPDINIYFDFDVPNGIYSSFLSIKKQMSIELPFITKNNRKFRIDNIIIPEKFMLKGENVIYIVDMILSSITDKITVKKIIENLKLFETEN